MIWRRPYEVLVPYSMYLLPYLHSRIIALSELMSQRNVDFLVRYSIFCHLWFALGGPTIPRSDLWNNISSSFCIMLF